MMPRVRFSQLLNASYRVTLLTHFNLDLSSNKATVSLLFTSTLNPPALTTIITAKKHITLTNFIGLVILFYSDDTPATISYIGPRGEGPKLSANTFVLWPKSVWLRKNPFKPFFLGGLGPCSLRVSISDATTLVTISV